MRYLYMLLATLVFGSDQWMKKRIENSDTDQRERACLGGRILIRKHHNRGILLNMGSGRRPLVAALSLVLTAVVLIGFLASLGQRGNGVLRTGLALLLGGAFSNTYDRLRRKYVVDYLSFGVKWQGLRRVVFNLADFGIILGALLAVLGTGGEG